MSLISAGSISLDSTFNGGLHGYIVEKILLFFRLKAELLQGRTFTYELNGLRIG